MFPADATLHHRIVKMVINVLLFRGSEIESVTKPKLVYCYYRWHRLKRMFGSNYNKKHN